MRSRQFNLDPTSRVAVRRLRNMYEAAREVSPETVAKGMQWYDNVNEAARTAGRTSGKGARAAAGVVAAVSPNMDWETNNIRAFDEMDSLSHKDWEVIRQSRSQNGRTDEAKDVLRGMGISRAGDRDLLVAHAIWHGGVDPEAAMPRRNRPKTNSFFHNILNPHQEGPVTVDGRHADIIVDAMRPWGSKNSGGISPARGIGSADLQRGVSRYERYEDFTRAAASRYDILPHQLQAVAWEMGKQVERGFDPTRKQGDARRGQSYQRRLSHFLADQGS